MNADKKWEPLRDGRGASLGVQYDAFCRIASLEQSVTVLREALEPFAAIETCPEPLTGMDNGLFGYVRPHALHEACEKARAALQQISPEKTDG